MSGLPPFQSPALLRIALTHRSCLTAGPADTPNNERLEFLGDAVLTFLCGEWLYKKFPDRPEGELTLLRAALVDETQLSNFAQRLNLGAKLQLGRGLDTPAARQNPNLLSSAFEALIGAYYLDSGSDIEAVRRYVEPLFASVIDRVIATPVLNYKGQLQEWSRKELGLMPKYTVTTMTGPPHARQFTVCVTIDGQPYGTGTGRRKQEAEKAAAKVALTKLRLL